MPDLVTGVLAFVQARWKESGGYSLTPRLPATVEDTFHLVNGHSAVNKLARRDDLVYWLRACQNYDGGFGFLPGSTSYVENCHTVLLALALLGAEPRDAAACRAFVMACRTGTGGFARINGAVAFLYSTWHAITALALLSPPHP